MNTSLISNMSDFRRWIANAPIGSDVAYHIDQRMHRNAVVFSAMGQASDAGQVMLYQRRCPENTALFEWRARRISPAAARAIAAISKSIPVRRAA